MSPPRRITRLLPLIPAFACGSWNPRTPADPTPYVVTLHERTVPMPVPPDNPMTVEGVSLGRHLFYDPIVSSDGTIACASCHLQEHAFSDPRPVSIGVHGRKGRRNAMPLFNLAWNQRFFWDGRAPTLEAQVVMPIQNEIEMDRPLDDLVVVLQSEERYPPMFDAAFPGQGVSAGTIAKALAQFVRSIVSFDATWDHIGHIDDVADNPAAHRGHLPFTSPLPLGDPNGDPILCNRCHDARAGIKPSWADHSAGLFTIDEPRSNGFESSDDLGVGALTGKPEDRGRFKVPSLRNAALTAPYMHDGSIATLQGVLEHYNTQIAATADPPLTRDGVPLKLNLDPASFDDVVAFIDLFTDHSLPTNPAWSDPFDE